MLGAQEGRAPNSHGPDIPLGEGDNGDRRGTEAESPIQRQNRHQTWGQPGSSEYGPREGFPGKVTLSEDFWSVRVEQTGIRGKGKAPEVGSVWGCGGEDQSGCRER